MINAYLYNLYRFFYIKSYKDFSNFKDSTNQKINIADYVDSFFLRNGLKQNFKFIDIGCGDGVLTELIISKMRPNVNLVLVDPSSKMLQLAKERLSQSTTNKMNLIKGGLFTNYRLSDRVGYKYDLILTSHIFFWINNWQDSLQKIYELSSESSIWIASILSEDPSSYWYNIRKELLQIAHKDRAKLESAEKLIDLIYKSKNRIKIVHNDSFSSKLDFPNINLDVLLDKNVMKKPDKKVGKFISILQFLIRKPFGQLNQVQRNLIIKKLNEVLPINRYTFQIPEKIIYSKFDGH